MTVSPIERSRFANSAETIRFRAIRAELRREFSSLVCKQLRDLESAVRRLSPIRAIRLEQTGHVAVSSAVPSDLRCWILGLEMLIAEVRRREHEQAGEIMKLYAVSGLTWQQISARVQLAPMHCRQIFYGAVGLMVADGRCNPEVDESEMVERCDCVGFELSEAA